QRRGRRNPRERALGVPQHRPARRRRRGERDGARSRRLRRPPPQGADRPGPAVRCHALRSGVRRRTRPRDRGLGSDAIVNFDSWALTAAVFIPALGVLAIAAIPRAQEALIKTVALVTAALTGVVGVWLLFNFDYDRAGELQFVVDKTWIEVISSRYIIGIDGLSLPLLVLSM